MFGVPPGCHGEPCADSSRCGKIFSRSLNISLKNIFHDTSGWPGEAFATLLAAICARIGSRKARIKAGFFPPFCRAGGTCRQREKEKRCSVAHAFPARERTADRSRGLQRRSMMIVIFAFFMISQGRTELLGKSSLFVWIFNTAYFIPDKRDSGAGESGLRQSEKFLASIPSSGMNGADSPLIRQCS